MRIISLVPSITETLFDLGLTTKAIVGRTKFCIHPEDKIPEVEVVGGTKNINIEKIKILNPDLVIANKEENVKEQIEELQTFCKVWVTQIETIEDNYYFLKQLGNCIGRQEKAQLFNLLIYEVLHAQKKIKSLKTAYLIWQKPYMSVGSDTFIHHVLTELGFENVFKDKKRYPEISLQDLTDAEVIMLSSEPFPFKEKHIEEFQQIFPEKKILIVDGEAFSWFGTHLAKCNTYFETLLNALTKS